MAEKEIKHTVLPTVSDEELEKDLEKPITESDEQLESLDTGIEKPTTAEKDEFEFEYKGKEEPTKVKSEPAQTTIEDEQKILDAIKSKNPELKDIKSLADLTVKQAEHTPTKEEPPKQPDDKQATLDENDMKLINQYTIQESIQDPNIQVYIQSAMRKSAKMAESDSSIKPIQRFPVTKEEWDNLYDLFPEIYRDVYGRVNQIRDSLSKEALDFKNETLVIPQNNVDIAKNFAIQVENYVKKLNPNITEADVKIVKDKLETFFTKAMNDGKYYDSRNGKLNGSLLYADFVTSETDALSNIAKLGIKSNGETRTKEKLENIQKGVSQTTLASKNKSGSKTVIRDFKNPLDMVRSSDEELEMAIDADTQEILKL